MIRRGRPTLLASGIGLLGLSLLALGQHLSLASERVLVRAADGRMQDELFLLQTPAKVDSGPAAASAPQNSTSSLRLLWKRAFPREISWAFRQPERAEPVVVGDQILVGGSRFAGVWVLEKRSGAVSGTLAAHGGLEVPPVVDTGSGDYIMADNGGFIQRIKPDGTKVWEYESQGPVLSKPALGQGMVLFHDIDGTLVALDLQTGTPLWVYRRPARIGESLTIFGAANPLILGDRVITGFSDGRAAALKLTDGSLLWEQPILAEGRWLDVDGDITPLGDTHVLVSAFKGATTCLNVESGEQVWKVAYGSPGGVLAREGRVYVSDTAGAVYALNGKTGEQLWKWETPAKAQPMRPTLLGAQLLVPLASGELQRVDVENGQTLGAIDLDENVIGFSAPVVVEGDEVYAVSDGGYVYAFGPRKPDLAPLASKRAAWSHLNY